MKKRSPKTPKIQTWPKSVTFSCQAQTVDQIERWMVDAQSVMFGAKANRSDVLAIMVAAMQACDWKPGRIIELTISPVSETKPYAHV